MGLRFTWESGIQILFLIRHLSAISRLSHFTPIDAPALRPYYATIGFVNNFG
jgi:hypothetical protein